MSQLQKSKDCLKETEVGEEFSGHEVLCRASNCIHNARPSCEIHTMRNPIVIEAYGRCVRFEDNNGVTQAEKEALSSV